MDDQKRIEDLAQLAREERATLRARMRAGEVTADVVGDAEREYLAEAMRLYRSELAGRLSGGAEAVASREAFDEGDRRGVPEMLRYVAAELEACEALEEHLGGVS